ncbi:hypothetical protein ACFL6C_02565, partial [Myxococcota bacterium]
VALLLAGKEVEAHGAFRESARRGGREILVRLTEAPQPEASKKKIKTKSKAAKANPQPQTLDSRDLHRILESVFSDMSTEKPQKRESPKKEKAPEQLVLGARRGSGLSNIPVAALLQWHSQVQ